MNSAGSSSRDPVLTEDKKMIPIPLNLRGIIVVSIALAGLTLVYIQMNSMKKIEYEKTTGKIVYMGKQFGQFPIRDVGKYRYIKVVGYEYPFEIFVGQESGDFKPKFEKIDSLNIGDTVTIYYYETENTKNESINRFIQFIDKKAVSYFERGNSSKTLGAILISMCGIMIISGVVLWKKKKIEF